MRLQVSINDGTAERDVMIETDPALPVSELARALDLPLRSVTDSEAPDAETAAAGPVSGARLSRDTLPVQPSVGGWQLQITAGPFAGACLPLTKSVQLGRGADCDLVLPDPSASRYPTLFEPRAGGATVTNAGASTLLVNGAPEDGPCEITPRDTIEIGSSVLQVAPVLAADAHIKPDELGGLAFNRATRIRANEAPRTITSAGAPPDEQYRTPLPWAMAAAPLALGIGTAVTTGNPLGLLLGVVSPLMVIVNSLVQRRNNARRGNRTLQRWQEDKAAADAKLAEITDVERARAWRDLPSPVTVAQIATGPSARLWERRITDPDALLVRLGVAAREVPVKVEGARRSHDPAPMMSPVPVGVDLNTAPILGVAAPRAVVRSIGRWVLLQLAVLRSPRDLRIVVLCDEDAVADWQWLRWLPHMSIDLAVAPVVLIGNTAETREQRLKELLRDIEARKSMLDDQRSVSFGSQTIVLIDGARKYRTLPGMVQILTDGPGVGVRVVALDSSRARLPEEASAEIVVDAAQPAMASLEVAGLAPLAGMLIDCVDPVTAEQAARAMAPLKPVGGDGDGGALPDTLRLIDLLDLDLDDPDWLPAQWALGGRSTRAAVGAGVDGAFLLDLKADGPHALVSGTTGAGKSEFLQSWVASLALVNRPDALNFVLVDYKGASALADCERLPHTVGLVTNLDNRETERALTSLDAELKRRELALKELGVKDVDDAWDRDPAFAARYGLARLALVIDEFAELVHELPDFVKGLVRIARVGRSLGVHLVLATQRPAGVVSAEMQSNVGLRIALRMADKENSQEVLGSTDSAFISPSTPGRGYARRGGGVALAAFQAARVAGRRRGARAETTPSVTVPPPVVRNVAWPQLGEPLDLRRVQAADDQSATDLHAVVELIRAAATRLDIPANSSPWLPALPEFIAATEVNAEVSGRRPMERSRSVTIGLQDVPAEQAQRPLTYDLETASHLLIAGSARSGRTTALRTLIAALVQQWSAAELHLYVIDFGGGLLPTVALPHAGAIVTGSEGERIERLLWRLREELTIRQGILQGGGFGDIGEQRAAAPVESRMPYLLLVIDRWEGFTSSYTFEEFQELRNLILALLREGPSVGIRLVIAGDRTLLSGHVIGFIDTRYVLRLADRADYSAVGIRPDGLPESIPAGRAYFGNPICEAQFASISDDLTGPGQAAALRSIAATINAATINAATINAAPTDAGPTDAALTNSAAGLSGPKPFRLDALPQVVEFAHANALPVSDGSDAADFLIGIGGDDLAQYRGGFLDGTTFLVAGRRHSGRSTALAAIASSLHADGAWSAIVIAMKPSPLSRCADALSLPMVNETTESAASVIKDYASAYPDRLVIVVDDPELVHGTPVNAAVMALARDRGPGTLGVVVGAVAANVGGWVDGIGSLAKNARNGLMLSVDNIMLGDLLGERLPSGMVGRFPPGRAALHTRAGYVMIQIPLPAGSG